MELFDEKTVKFINEAPVGTYFIFDNNLHQIIKSAYCTNCILKETENCEKIKCGEYDRQDKTGVIIREAYTKELIPGCKVYINGYYYIASLDELEKVCNNCALRNSGICKILHCSNITESNNRNIIFKRYNRKSNKVMDKKEDVAINIKVENELINVRVPLVKLCGVIIEPGMYIEINTEEGILGADVLVDINNNLIITDGKLIYPIKDINYNIVLNIYSKYYITNDKLARTILYGTRTITMNEIKSKFNIGDNVKIVIKE